MFWHLAKKCMLLACRTLTGCIGLETAFGFPSYTSPKMWSRRGRVLRRVQPLSKPLAGNGSDSDAVFLLLSKISGRCKSRVSTDSDVDRERERLLSGYVFDIDSRPQLSHTRVHGSKSSRRIRPRSRDFAKSKQADQVCASLCRRRQCRIFFTQVAGVADSEAGRSLGLSLSHEA